MCATKQSSLRNDSMTIILPRLIVKIDCAVRGKKIWRGSNTVVCEIVCTLRKAQYLYEEQERAVQTTTLIY